MYCYAMPRPSELRLYDPGGLSDLNALRPTCLLASCEERASDRTKSKGKGLPASWHYISVCHFVECLALLVRFVRHALRIIASLGLHCVGTTFSEKHITNTASTRGPIETPCCSQQPRIDGSDKLRMETIYPALIDLPLVLLYSIMGR